jgi:hypothetical protein
MLPDPKYHHQQRTAQHPLRFAFYFFWLGYVQYAVDSNYKSHQQFRPVALIKIGSPLNKSQDTGF